MTDPNISDLKDEERLKIDIPIEEEAPGAAKAGHTTDLVEEFKRLGRQFGDTVQAAFNSEEARRMETELRAGMRSFADEVAATWPARRRKAWSVACAGSASSWSGWPTSSRRPSSRRARSNRRPSKKKDEDHTPRTLREGPGKSALPWPLEPRTFLGLASLA